jgi:4-azaleucine resistance transporter AzlC
VAEASNQRSGYREGAARAAPLAVAVFGFGVSFGVLTRSVGMGWLAPIVMSATTFAGAAQFAAVSVLGTGGSVLSAIGAAVLLNSRYVPIGLSVAPAFKGGPLRRLLGAQLVVDESWAIGHLGGGRFDLKRLLGAGAVLYVAWLLGTVVGVFGAGVLGDPAKLGLDAAFPALFLGLLVGQVHDRRGVAAAVLGAAIALALVPFAPAGVPIIAASAACLLGLGRGEPADTHADLGGPP